MQLTILKEARLSFTIEEEIKNLSDKQKPKEQNLKQKQQNQMILNPMSQKL